MSATKHQSAEHPLKQIYFYLTGGCNLRCRHCWVISDQAKTEALLDPELFESIVKQGQLLGLTSVKLTGGEPCLHPQLRRLIDFVKDADLHLVVETNGVLLTPELAGAVAGCRSSFVSVSLDGSEAETHEWVRGVPGCFQAAIQGIRYLVEAGLKPQIIFSMMRRNRDQVEKVVRLAQELGAGSVKFNIVQASPRADVMQESQETLTIEELLELGYWVERELINEVDIPLLFHHPPAFRPLNLLCGGDAKGYVCGILNIIGVLPDGSYALCGIGGYVPEMVFGHAAHDRLADVWVNHPVLRDIREGLPHRLTGICGECLVRSRCLGFCLAQNYYHAQDLWAPYWFCDQAAAAGLFPTTRKRPASLEKIAKGL